MGIISADDLPLLFAALALLIAFWHGHLTRRHNRLSVKPRLVLEARLARGEDAGLGVLNGGLGPAIIKSTSFTVAGKQPGECSLETWTSSLQELLSGTDLNAAWFSRNSLIQPGKFEYLVWIRSEDRNDASDELLETAIEQVGFKITYESAYGGKSVAVWPD